MLAAQVIIQRFHNRRGPYLGVVVVIGLNCSVDKVTGTASYRAWQLLWCRWLLLCASCGRRHKMDDFTIVTDCRLIESTGSGNAAKPLVADSLSTGLLAS